MSSHDVVLQQEDIIIGDPWESFTADTPMRMPGDSEYDEDTETSMSDEEHSSEIDQASSETDKEDLESDEADSEADSADSEGDEEDFESDEAGSEDDVIAVNDGFEAVNDEYGVADDEIDFGNEESGSEDEVITSEDDELKADRFKKTGMIGIMSYDKNHRGIAWSEIAEGGMPVPIPRSCTETHLLTVRVNIEQLLTLFMWFHDQPKINGYTREFIDPEDQDFIDDEKLKHMLEITDLELSRLQRHPELFPSEGIMEEFWNDICNLNDDLLESALPMLKACDVDERILHILGVERREDLRLHARDTNRKPWEQFLHNGAPGSGVDVSALGDGGSVQVLPSSAMWILHASHWEYNATIRDIEAERRATSTLHEELAVDEDFYYGSEGRSTDNGYTKRFLHGTQLLPALGEHVGQPPVVRGLDSLETLNGMFTMYTRRGMPARNIWDRCGIIVCRCPTGNVQSQHMGDTE